MTHATIVPTLQKVNPQDSECHNSQGASQFSATIQANCPNRVQLALKKYTNEGQARVFPIYASSRSKSSGP